MEKRIKKTYLIEKGNVPFYIKILHLNRIREMSPNLKTKTRGNRGNNPEYGTQIRKNINIYL